MYGLSLKDPTCAFTLGVLVTPLLFVDSISAGLAYLTQPAWLLSYAYLAFWLYVAYESPHSYVKLSERDLRVANWFLLNGVYFNLFLDVVSGTFQASGEMSKQYLNVDPRYAIGHSQVEGQSVFWTSMLETFFESPLCLLAFVGYVRDASWRRPVELFACVLHATGVWYFYLPEIFTNFPSLGGWPKTTAEALSFERILFFWFGFWFCGTLWVVIPLRIGWTASVEIAEDFKIASLTREVLDEAEQQQQQQQQVK